MAVASYPFLDKSSFGREEFDYIYKRYVYDIIYKCCNLYGHNSLIMLFGTMFSGMKITSSGNTACMTILYELYLLELAEKYDNDPVVRIVLEAEMMPAMNFGDDHNHTWPVWMNNRLLYDDSKSILEDYANYCVRVWQMKYKLDEFQLYESYYSVHSYVTQTDGSFVEVAKYEGPTFIKNAPSITIVDGQPVGIYPYQESHHLLCKLYGMAATQNLELSLCLISSLARLSSGNLEVYSQLRILYSKIREKVGRDPSLFAWTEFLTGKNGRSLDAVSKALKKDEPPSFPTLPELWAIQNNGYITKTGFCMRNEDGVSYDMTPIITNTFDGELQPTLESQRENHADFLSEFIDSDSG